jgi:hypothetical protein
LQGTRRRACRFYGDAGVAAGCRKREARENGCGALAASARGRPAGVTGPALHNDEGNAMTHDEVNALRARAEKAELEYATEYEQRDYWQHEAREIEIDRNDLRVQLAAAQANVRALLVRIAGWHDLVPEGFGMGPLVRSQMRAALAAPQDDSALRALMVEAALDAMYDAYCDASTFANSTQEDIRKWNEAIVDRVLSNPNQGAKP